MAIGAKRIETRSWSTRYRGPLAIHAAKGLGPVGGVFGLREQCRVDDVFYQVLRNLITGIRGEPLEPADALPRGAIIAVCELKSCIQIAEHDQAYALSNGPYDWPLTEQERAFGDYTPSRFAWLLDNVRVLSEPIPARGALSLWEWTPPEGFAL